MLNGRCQQICTNKVGSFSCSCTEGYELQMDNIRCQGELATPYKLIGCLENYQQPSMSGNVLNTIKRRFYAWDLLCEWSASLIKLIIVPQIIVPCIKVHKVLECISLLRGRFWWSNLHKFVKHINMSPYGMYLMEHGYYFLQWFLATIVTVIMCVSKTAYVWMKLKCAAAI